MSTATSADYTDLFQSLEQIDKDKKDLTESANALYATFSEQFGLHPDALKTGYKDYIKFMKDPAKFHEVDADLTTIMTEIIRAKQAQEGIQ